MAKVQTEELPVTAASLFSRGTILEAAAFESQQINTWHLLDFQMHLYRSWTGNSE